MGLLAILTEGAVEGVVRDVLIVDAECSDVVAEAVAALCEETGAIAVGDMQAAFAKARSDWLLVLPAAMRMRNGWVEALSDHLRDGGGPAILRGEGPFWKAAYGVVIRRDVAASLAHPDLKRLRGKLGPSVPRIG